MNILDAKKKIGIIKEKLQEMKGLTRIDPEAFKDNEFGQPYMDPGAHMEMECPEEDSKLKVCWKTIQENVPPGFSIDGNLIRHLNFDEAHDWYDISDRDVPRELVKVDEYITKLNLVAYLNSLHPEVSRVSSTVLDGDFDSALKTVYASLESKIRNYLKLSPTESTVPAIAKAFKDGKMAYPVEEYNESIRNFLQGVIGFYRSNLVHNTLPPDRNNLESCLSLFTLAHESFLLLDECTTTL